MIKFLKTYKYYFFIIFILINIVTIGSEQEIGSDEEHSGSLPQQQAALSSSQHHQKSKSDSEEDLLPKFYVFDVGQGNAQFIVYPKEKIGFLYDAGSASKNKHFKFLSNQKLVPFLIPQPKAQLFGSDEEEEEDEAKKSKFISKQQHFLANSDEEQSLSQSSSQNKGKHSAVIATRLSTKSKESAASNAAKDASNIPNIRQSIQNTIASSGIDILFVFLSHPDKDHINFFSNLRKEPDILPDNLKIMIFACGLFIYNESQDVKNFLSYINKKKQTNKNIRLLFPYTWGNSTKEEFFKLIERDTDEDLIQCSFYNFLQKAKQYEPTAFEDIVSLLVRKESESNHESIGSSIEPSLQKKLFITKNFFSEEENKSIEALKDRVFIWGINYRDNDVNAQSTVMSFKLSDDLSLTVTGDAEPSTFEAIVRKANEQQFNVEQMLGRNRILVIPHHGAEDNITEEIATFFKPNLAIISAANGKQFGHPHQKVIKWLSEIINQQEFNKAFMKTGPQDNTILCCGKKYEEDKWYNKASKTEDAKKFSTLRTTDKIISTNVSGTISFENGIFYSAFSSLLEHTEENFLISFSQSISPSDFNKFNITKEDTQLAINTNDGLLKKEDNFYFVIKNESDNNNIKVYKMKKIEEDTQVQQE